MPSIKVIDGDKVTVYEDICHIQSHFQSNLIAILRREDTYEIIYMNDTPQAQQSLEQYIADSDSPCDLHNYYVTTDVHANLKSVQKQNQAQIRKLEELAKEKDEEIQLLRSYLNKLLTLCDSHEHSNTFHAAYKNVKQQIQSQLG